ncbi:LysR substrate-binding domain-containing protein [Paenibacillus sp. GCM10012307]|uniref:LysR family transcriptional regulator n=1 Tax=Paenibacillus roseus TaxID=2798579 RepID=A0A934IX96_9BACL|nr:LysR family transcriptional regulator [Paenibacillus roseus]MBJ6360977.1 LysR family transcriptional regulator [Paenibacillus roseus]
MNLLKLQILELIEQHKKITAVANKLGLKQPTVTYHMKSLEQEMGVKLFETRADKIFLTEAGKAMHHYAALINRLASEAERIVYEFGSLTRGHLTIGASYIPATYLLPRVLNKFAELNPNIGLSVIVEPASLIKEKLMSHDIDLGLISSEPFVLPPISARNLCKDELMVIYSPDHHLAAQDKIDPGWIAASNFILHGSTSSTRDMTDRWLKQHRVQLVRMIELDSIEAIKKMVRQGNHIAFVSRLAVEDELRQETLLGQPVPYNDFQRSIYCCYNKERYDSRLTEQFINALLEWNEPFHDKG